MVSFVLLVRLSGVGLEFLRLHTELDAAEGSSWLSLVSLGHGRLGQLTKHRDKLLQVCLLELLGQLHRVLILEVVLDLLRVDVVGLLNDLSVAVRGLDELVHQLVVFLFLHEVLELLRDIQEVVGSANGSSVLPAVTEYIVACNELVVEHDDDRCIRLSNNSSSCAEGDVESIR